MDKDLLRLVIIAIGGIVILGMILWSLLKNKRQKRSIDFYDKGNPLENIDESLVLNTENDDFDIVPLGSAIDDDPITVASRDFDQQAKVAVETKKPVPDIIQFSIVAKDDKGFNGAELSNAFEQLGLEYGNMKVFERLDEQRRVDFAVASMVEPGTFPESDLETFYSPGIAFFLQPKELDNPLDIYNEFVETIKLLSTTLDGVSLDHKRQPLSAATIQNFRTILSN